MLNSDSMPSPRQVVHYALAGGLWSLAAAMLYVDLDVLPGVLNPLASAYSDWTEVVSGMMTAGRRILVPSLALYGFLGVLAAWLKNFDLRVTSPFAPIAVVLATEEIGIREFLVPILPAIAILAVVTIRAHRADEQTRRWVNVLLPASLTGVGLAGMVYRWSGHYSLREQIGAAPTISFVVFSASCLLIAFPALWSARGMVVRLIVLIAGGWLVSLHSFDANFPIHARTPPTEAKAERPHVVLIVVDTLRADVLSYRNEQAPPTPHIDALAAESVVFENAISPSSWTFPAMTSLMTGLTPLQSRSSNIPQYDTVRKPTMAQILRQHGYDTRAIVGNPLLYRPFQVAEGFHRIETYAVEPFGEGEAWKTGTDGRQEAMHSITTRLLTDQAVHWTRQLTDQPSFLWLHYLDPHDPYLPPREFSEPIGAGELNDVQTQRRLYQGEVRFIDSEIGRLVDTLKQEGVYDESIIIFTSDHGEEFLEHGEMGHGADLYQEVLHVPMLIRMPGGSARKTVSDYVPSNALLPTLMDLLALAEPSREGWPSSLAPLIEKQDASYDHPVVSGANRRREPQWSIVIGGMKYIYREQTDREDVYDLVSDPHERRSLTDPPGDFVAQAREALERHLEFAEMTLREEGMSPSRGVDEDLRDRLRALGYVQ